MINWKKALPWILNPVGDPPRDLLTEAVRKGEPKPFKPSIRLPRGVKAKAKKDSIPKLKKELDRVFSIFIRQRDCNLGDGWGRCATCGVAIHAVQTAQASHYQVRQDLATRWNEKNVHAACGNCNGFRGGEPEKMAEYINKKYGILTAIALRTLAREPFKLNRDWLQRQIAHYKARIGAEGSAEGLARSRPNLDSALNPLDSATTGSLTPGNTEGTLMTNPAPKGKNRKAAR